LRFNYTYKRPKEVIKIPANNPVKEIRERLMISKAELARTAGISVLTVDRVEKGKSCRPITKRKIVEALGCNPWQGSITHWQHGEQHNPRPSVEA